MAYEKTTWVSGDVITAENMNKIEDELATLDEKGDSVVSFELGDRIAKGVDTNGNVVDGAVIEGLTKDTEIEGQVVPKNAASGIYSHAEGSYTKASGNYSHAEGSGTIASGNQSHAEGSGTIASGDYSHAEGIGATASGRQSHAEGAGTKASGNWSHAEGGETEASGAYSHAEGNHTISSGAYSHAEGNTTTASGDSSHAEGNGTTASGVCSHAEGSNTTALDPCSHAEGYGTIASGSYQHVQGKYNIEDTNNVYAHIVGAGTKAQPKNIHTLDWNGNAVYSGKVTVGVNPTDDMDLATKKYVDENVGRSFDLSDRIAKGVNDKSETVTGAVIEGLVVADSNGYVNIASGIYSHAEGYHTTASGTISHAEGSGTIASGAYSHAEGNDTTASTSMSHAEGYGTTASGTISHAEGNHTTASGALSHAEGDNTIASGLYSHVQGKFNIEDAENKYAHIVGGGKDNNNRKNIHTLDWSGNAYFAGSLTLGGTTLTEEQLKKLIALLN